MGRAEELEGTLVQKGRCDPLGYDANLGIPFLDPAGLSPPVLLQNLRTHFLDKNATPVIYFYGRCTKVSGSLFPREHIVVLTSTALYLARKDGSLKRCIPMRDIVEMIQSDDYWVGLRVKASYDLLLKPRSPQDCRSLTDTLVKLFDVAMANEGSDTPLRVRKIRHKDHHIKTFLSLSRPKNRIEAFEPIETRPEQELREHRKPRRDHRDSILEACSPMSSEARIRHLASTIARTVRSGSQSFDYTSKFPLSDTSPSRCGTSSEEDAPTSPATSSPSRGGVACRGEDDAAPTPQENDLHSTPPLRPPPSRSVEQGRQPPATEVCSPSSTEPTEPSSRTSPRSPSPGSPASPVNTAVVVKDAVAVQDAVVKDAVAVQDAVVKDAVAVQDAVVKDAVVKDTVAVLVKDAVVKDGVAVQDAVVKDAVAVQDAVVKDGVAEDVTKGRNSAPPSRPSSPPDRLPPSPPPSPPPTPPTPSIVIPELRPLRVARRDGPPKRAPRAPATAETVDEPYYIFASKKPTVQRQGGHSKAPHTLQEKVKFLEARVEQLLKTASEGSPPHAATSRQPVSLPAPPSCDDSSNPDSVHSAVPASSSSSSSVRPLCTPSVSYFDVLEGLPPVSPHRPGSAVMVASESFQVSRAVKAAAVRCGVSSRSCTTITEALDAILGGQPCWVLFVSAFLLDNSPTAQLTFLQARQGGYPLIVATCSSGNQQLSDRITAYADLAVCLERCRGSLLPTIADAMQHLFP